MKGPRQTRHVELLNNPLSAEFGVRTPTELKHLIVQELSSFKLVRKCCKHVVQRNKAVLRSRGLPRYSLAIVMQIATKVGYSCMRVEGSDFAAFHFCLSATAVLCPSTLTKRPCPQLADVSIERQKRESTNQHQYVVVFVALAHWFRSLTSHTLFKSHTLLRFPQR